MTVLLPALLLLSSHAPAQDAEEVTRPAARPAVDMEIRERSGQVLYGEPVNRVYIGTLDHWRVIDEQRLILYRTRSRPYLVTLMNRAPQMRFNALIGLRLRDRNLDARFDSIYVDGFPYRIQRIEKLTPDVADLLLGGRPDPDDPRAVDAKG